MRGGEVDSPAVNASEAATVEAVIAFIESYPADTGRNLGVSFALGCQKQREHIVECLRSGAWKEPR